MLAGGFNSNSIFEYIDYELISKNPKIICGFSDITAITNIIYAGSGLVTFNSSTFISLTSWETNYAYKEMMKRFVAGSLEFGTKDDEYITIRKGREEGVLVGGNLSILSRLAAGKYRLDFRNKIIFIEELGLESPPGLVSSYLYFMKQNGVFDKIKGIWVGNYEHESGISLEKILLDVLGDEYDFPIIKSNNFGHTDKKTVIPIGVRAAIDTDKESKIIMLEKCLN